MPILASEGCFWPLTASITLEVKNDHAYVIMQGICNKFIEVNLFVRYMVSQLIRLFWSNIQYFSNIDEIDVAGWPAQQSFFRGSILWNLTLQNEQIWLVKRSFYLLCTLIVLCSPDRKVTLKGHYKTPWGSKNVSNILIMTDSTPIQISQLTK